ncbi:cell wall anchor protein [Verrucosispora sioxanthis]|uniref:Cell wall anchor protein n=1 Tax=Verrucosispora sioxanthis TaxID=2499994 RepID=A0A6M1LCP2_9ACTN|nr:cell wall anchor protein [Verrucosispora sioxanthis]NEE66859.1 cell wall anchor protein [Verrucosispora sioxanthis]NGM15969.1 cell wall anchor protein [Verrucosispora sioxanthis]
MQTRVVRRWFAGVAVVVLATVAAGAPAAAEPAAKPVAYVNNVVVATDGPQKWASLRLLGDQQVGTYTVRVDRRDVMAFADVEPGDEPGVCTVAGAVVTCELTIDGDWGSELLSLAVTAAAGAQPGQQGELLFTVTAPDGTTGTYRSTVAVGEGVDLATERTLTLDSSLGGRVDVPLTVRNRGTKTAHGMVLYLSGSYGFTPSKRYENCEYSDPDLDSSTFACTFDNSLEPGAALRVDPTFGGTVPADSWAPNLHHSYAVWFTPADWAEFRSQSPTTGPLGPKGTDEALTLVPVGGTQARALGQTDTDTLDNETRITLTVDGDQRGDVAAEGATVTGAVGDTVEMRVGYLNNGPASAGPNGQRGLNVETIVTLPTNVTAVTAPQSCVDRDADEWQPGKPGARVYVCLARGTISRGERLSFEFDLRIDRADGKGGTVRLHTFDGAGPVKDLDPANDTAKIQVRLSGSGGGGGSLPITGASTGLLVGIGLALIAAGALGYLLARRGRLRFTV